MENRKKSVDSHSQERIKRARRLVLKGMPGTTLFALGDRRRGAALLTLSGLGPLWLVLFGLFPVGPLLLTLLVWFVLWVCAEMYEWHVVGLVAEGLDDVPCKTPLVSWVFSGAALVACVVFAATFTPKHSVRRIASDGMAPTVVHGDAVIFERLDAGATIARGDVVTAWVDPEAIIAERAYWVRGADGRYIVVGRVVGVPGDQVEASEQGISVNGTSIDRGADRVFVVVNAAGARRQWTLQPESYFVAGDGDESGSSASFGLIPRHQILERAKTILWASSVGRIGRAVE